MASPNPQRSHEWRQDDDPIVNLLGREMNVGDLVSFFKYASKDYFGTPSKELLNMLRKLRGALEKSQNAMRRLVGFAGTNPSERYKDNLDTSFDNGEQMWGSIIGFLKHCEGNAVSTAIERGIEREMGTASVANMVFLAELFANPMTEPMIQKIEVWNSHVGFWLQILDQAGQFESRSSQNP